MALPASPDMPGNRVSQTTVQRPPIQLAFVTVDATALLKTTSSWADMKSSAIRIPAEWRKLSLSFYGYGDGDGAGDPDGATFAWKVYTVDYNYGAQLIGNGTGVIGKQQLSHNPTTGAELNSGDVDLNYCWADTIAEVAMKVERDITYSDFAGDDSIAALHFDRYAAYGILVIITAMTAQSVTKVTCVMNGHNT